MVKIIIIDYNDVKSIRSAEKRKAHYENEGMYLNKTEQIGLNKFRLEYIESEEYFLGKDPRKTSYYKKNRGK